MSATDDTRQSLQGDLHQPGNPATPVPHRRTTPTSSSRSAVTLLEVSHRLRPRDYALALLLDQHVMLTTDQIAAVLFTSVITCQHRLHDLRRLRFIDRFARNNPGTARPLCWVPGVLSARYATLARGDTPASLRVLRERQDRIFASPMLDHLIGTNEFFVRLLAHSRRQPHTRLVRWWSERDTNAAYGRRINPDGHGVWVDGARSVGFFLEYDRGTEPLGRLVAKLASHRRLQADGGPDYPVLFVLPGRVREQNLHRKLAESMNPGVTVATACLDGETDPAATVWQVAGNGRQRLALAELASSHGVPGPFNPAILAPEQDPLHAVDPR